MRDKVQQLARYYLAELWNDADFRADWQRVKAAVSSDAELADLWRRVQNPDLSPEERVQADCALRWRVKTVLSDFCTRWNLPPVIALAFEHELAIPPETRALYDRVVPDPTAYELQRLQERIIGHTPTGQVVVIQEVEEELIATLEPQLPEPPLKCLPEPMPAAETQAQYLARVNWEAAKREYRERFPNLRISEGALREHVEAILKGYYNACAELIPPTRYYNRTMSDTYLQLAARRIYLAVIEKKPWKEVAYETGLASFKKAREDTLKNMAILGIPAECVARRKTRKPRD